MAMTAFAATDIHFPHPTTRGFAITRMIDVWRSRRALAELDSHRLEDIGLDVKRALHEESKPIWNVPAAWRG